MIELDTIYNCDCFDGMKQIPDGTIDAIICDLPYGVLNKGNKHTQWDSIIPFEPLWEEYNRIIKKNGNIVLFSSGLFTYKLIESNIKNYKYKLIWKKNIPTGMASAKYRPMKYYEEICVFNEGNGLYNPIMKERIGVGKECYNYDHYCGKSNHIDLEKKPKRYDPNFVQPSDVLEFNVVPNRKGKLHPTQKPIELLQWLVKTYTNEGELILDSCCGSGTTAVACLHEHRHFIGFESNKEYYDKACERIRNEHARLNLF